MGGASPTPRGGESSIFTMERTGTGSSATVPVVAHRGQLALVPEPEGALLALVGGARDAYVQAIVRRLSEAGFSDLPRNGWHVLSGVAARTASADGFARELGVTKQRASQLIRALVERGYLQRHVDGNDRRRLSVGLTGHGRAAVAAVRSAVAGIDAQLAELVSPAELAGLRTGLAALTWIGRRDEDARAAPAPA